MWNQQKIQDWQDYSNKGLVDTGRNVPKYGLEFEVVDSRRYDSAAKIKISRR